MPRIPAFLSLSSLPEAPSLPASAPAPIAWRQRLRSASRTLIATDFDGTLAPIVAEPAAATPLPGITGVLAKLAARRDTRVAIVSGRALTDLRARCPVPGCWYVGGHGNETLPGAGGEGAESSPQPHAQAMRRHLAALADELRSRLPQWPGVRLEAKPYSLALHFRLAPQWEEPIRELFSRYAASGHFRVLLGRQVIELLPEQALTKGHAVARLRRRLGCDLAFYFGDDTTDEDVFRLPNTHLIGVKVENTENAVPTAASYCVSSPREVLLALEAMADLRQESATAPHAKEKHA